VSPIFHVGRKVPKGWVELPGGIHLGRGIWMLPMRPEVEVEGPAHQDERDSYGTRLDGGTTPEEANP
jgi:hypothetical protein